MQPGISLGLQAICLNLGIPGAIYADQHTIFQSLRITSLAQELTGNSPAASWYVCWTS